MPMDKLELGKRIRALRKARHMRQDVLAEIAGFSKVFLWQVETGRANVTIDGLIAVAGALGCELDFFLIDPNNPKGLPERPVKRRKARVPAPHYNQMIELMKLFAGAQDDSREAILEYARSLVSFE